MNAGSGNYREVGQQGEVQEDVWLGEDEEVVILFIHTMEGERQRTLTSYGW